MMNQMLRTARHLLRSYPAAHGHVPRPLLSLPHSSSSSLPLFGRLTTAPGSLNSVRLQTSGTAPASGTATSDALNLNVIRIDNGNPKVKSTNPNTDVEIPIETDEEINIRPDAWTIGQPTRMIAHKLLEKEKYACGLRELYDEANQTGMFKSKRHFKHCLKLLKCRERVEVVCIGPERVGSPKLKFSARLTRRGARTYLYFRQGYRNRMAKKIAEASDESKQAQ